MLLDRDIGEIGEIFALPKHSSNSIFLDNGRKFSGESCSLEGFEVEVVGTIYRKNF